METTREQVLRYVRGRPDATVAQLANALELSQQAVRRHLDGLRADGMLDVRLARHGVGRPTLVYFATERAEELSGHTYLELLTRFFRHLGKLDASEVGGAAGGQIVERVFSGIAAEVAANHQPEVSGANLETRVAQTSRTLEREGIVDGWHKDEDGVYHIENRECPYLRLAELSEAPCHSDRQVIELLIGAPVQQTSRIVEGAAVCEYIVRPEPVTIFEEATIKERR